MTSSIRRVVRRTHRLVEHAGSSVLVLAIGTVDEAIAQHMIVYAAVSALPVGNRTGESLHAIHGGRTLCKRNANKNG